MQSSIDFCIPFVGQGIQYFNFLIENCLESAEFPERLHFLASYHTAEDLEVLKTSPHFGRIEKLIQVQPYPQSMLFYPSANHSSAINAFAGASESDILIISDYDMAFVYRGWDSLIDILVNEQNIDVGGVTYAKVHLSNSMPALVNLMPWMKTALLNKYQDLPNLSFFFIRRQTLERAFKRKLTSFDNYLAKGGLPFRLINTPRLSQETNLPLGAMQWLDTGWEIPHVISEFQLNFVSFGYQTLMEQKVIMDKKPYEGLPSLLHPEFFCLNEDLPFLCHYKKGSMKSGTHQNTDLFLHFSSAIDDYLDLEVKPESVLAG